MRRPCSWRGFWDSGTEVGALRRACARPRTACGRLRTFSDPLTCARNDAPPRWRMLQCRDVEKRIRCEEMTVEEGINRHKCANMFVHVLEAKSAIVPRQCHATPGPTK